MLRRVDTMATRIGGSGSREPDHVTQFLDEETEGKNLESISMKGEKGREKPDFQHSTDGDERAGWRRYDAVPLDAGRKRGRRQRWDRFLASRHPTCVSFLTSSPRPLRPPRLARLPDPATRDKGLPTTWNPGCDIIFCTLGLFQKRLGLAWVVDRQEE